MRGYQKRVIYLKNTGSPLFDEAYFVIKKDAYRVSVSMPDMVREANRIISENIREKKKISLRSLGYIISFIVGASLSFVASLFLL